jgi:molybdate transport system ATP-binding protein
MQIKNLHQPDLRIEEFATVPGQAWCVLGDNRSGIDQFVALLSAGRSGFPADILQFPERLAILTFQAQQELFEEELRNDDSDFSDKPDPGTLVREFLPDHRNALPLLERFGMDHCLDLGYRQLSSGQARKLLLLRELTGGATTLLIQNPYDGLDQSSCDELNRTLSHLAEDRIELIVTVNTTSDIPPWCSHIALIDGGRLVHAGEKERILPLLGRGPTSNLEKIETVTSVLLSPATPQAPQREELVFLRNGFAGYGDKKLFAGLDLTIHTGDHTLITGPNGCGKSTLLDMITGDNSKCYANTLRVFGQRRGTGESIWQIKKQMGIVSPALHRDHRIPGSALQVVLSGLFDSIGLYHKVSPPEIRTARQWLAWIDLQEKADIPFRRLNFAEQRQVLIARALIKRPKLLILDEPTQGLDDVNRNTLLDVLEKAAAADLTTILFISHRKDEQRSFFRRRIKLDSFAP